MHFTGKTTSAVPYCAYLNLASSGLAIHPLTRAHEEAVRVDPEERGRGYGSQCVSDLSDALLARSRSVCLLADSNNLTAQALYRKLGYAPVGAYQAIFV